MPDTIPNLWPEEFNVDVQTPYAILRVQAELLGKMTRGILEGAVETEATNKIVQHRLVVIAPACNGYRHTLVVAIHQLDLPYPVQVQAGSLAFSNANDGLSYPSASSDAELQNFLGEVLRSDEVKAVILSLIARSKEAASETSSP